MVMVSSNLNPVAGVILGKVLTVLANSVVLADSPSCNQRGSLLSKAGEMGCFSFTHSIRLWLRLTA